MEEERLALCGLCGRRRDLCNSHILPEFFYKPAYDAPPLPRRVSVVSSDVEQATKHLQKGVREHLLCEECEALLSRHERVVANQIRDIVNVIGRNPRMERYDANVSYVDWRLCLLSIILRASLSRDAIFRGVSIGSRHEDTIKTILLEKDPGIPMQYGMVCACPLLWPGDAERKPQPGLLTVPRMSRLEAHALCIFLAHGLMFLIFVSSHTPPPNLAQFFLAADGSWPIVIGDAERNPWVFEAFAKLASAERERLAGGA